MCVEAEETYLMNVSQECEQAVTVMALAQYKIGCEHVKHAGKNLL